MALPPAVDLSILLRFLSRLASAVSDVRVR